MDYFFLTTSLLKIIGLLAVVLGIMNYAVYAERRISALIQDRLGPNRVGPAGLFQPIADAAKFLLKEDFTPRHVNTFYYWLAPCMLYRAVPDSARSFDFRALRDAAAGIPPNVQGNIFLLLLIGFGILVSLFPFHSWAPEAYASAPAPAAMLHAIDRLSRIVRVQRSEDQQTGFRRR